jgi:thiol-disulfide isomerase/thioredoxin
MASLVAQTAPARNTPALPLKLQKIPGDPAFTTIDLDALHGKAVVLEFWATWCAPCVGEIPAINRLASHTDPSEVQIISITDENPGKVEAFLRKHPIDGLVGIDTSGGVFRRYGVTSRPATFVIGPRGSIISNNVSPEHLSPAQLTSVARGGRHEITAAEDKAVSREVKTARTQAMNEQLRAAGAESPTSALFSLSLSPAKGGEAHAYITGANSYRLLNMDVVSLLQFALSCSRMRITTGGNISDKRTYNLTVEADGAPEDQLSAAVEMAIASATKTRIANLRTTESVLLLEPLPGNAGAGLSAHPAGIAALNRKELTAVLVRANAGQIASLAEEVLGTPVIATDGAAGACTGNFAIQIGNKDSLRSALEKTCRLTLKRGRGEVERIVVSRAPPGSPDRKTLLPP